MPGEMRLVTWNVNSIRSRTLRLFDWLARHQPDVVALQETKCSDTLFDAEFAGVFDEFGYQVAHHGHDHWNGVAIASRVGLAEVRRGFPGEPDSPFDEARLISAVCGGIDITSVYVPNGRELDDPHYRFKLEWLDRLRGAIDPDVPSMVVGDFNVAPTDLDIYDPVRWRKRTHASPAERAAVDALVEMGLVDVTREHLPGPGVFTWWSYRPGQFQTNRGLRIDLVLATPDVAANIERVWVDLAERADDNPDEKPSDHAPVVVDIAPLSDDADADTTDESD